MHSLGAEEMKANRALAAMVLMAGLSVASCAFMDQARLSHEGDGIGLTIPLPVAPASSPDEPAEEASPDQLLEILTAGPEAPLPTAIESSWSVSF
jgi:hypothetical protein